MQNQQNINVSIKDATPVACEECQHEVFSQQFMLRKVSRFVTGTTEDGFLPIPVFACSKCGHVNKDFLPPETVNQHAN